MSGRDTLPVHPAAKASGQDLGEVMGTTARQLTQSLNQGQDW